MARHAAVAAAVRDIAAVATVSVDGPSAAGRSTFARTLADELGAVVVHGDDFYRAMDPAASAALPPDDGANLDGGGERLRGEVLKRRRAGAPGTCRPHGWDRDALSDELVRMGPSRSVVEGVFVSRPELGGLMDVCALVKAPPGLRRRLQQERGDASTSWLGRCDAAERCLFERARRPDSLDIRVGAP